MRPKKSIVSIAMLVFVLFMLPTIMEAKGEDITVVFNFYEGIRSMETKTPAVAASYHLESLSKKMRLFESLSSRETVKLKKIYGLKIVKPLLHQLWLWRSGKSDQNHQVIVLNGHVYYVRLTPVKDNSRFRLEVIERIDQTRKHFLDTEFSLPADNTAIFGFQDNNDKIYFLSFHVAKPLNAEAAETGGPLELPTEELLVPVKRVDPVYPPEALQNNTEGTVIMTVTVDVSGNVASVVIDEGEYRALNEAAVKAVKQWKYKPYKIKGVARTVTFTVVLDFYFN